MFSKFDIPQQMVSDNVYYVKVCEILFFLEHSIQIIQEEWVSKEIC